MNGNRGVVFKHLCWVDRVVTIMEFGAGKLLCLLFISVVENTQ